MPFTRRIVHYSPGPTDFQAVISDRAVAGCWFELHRRGGCGAGELKLRNDFPDRHGIDIGDWIGLEYSAGQRWYLGRVETRQAESPAGVTYRLEGMSIELNEVFPGGFRPDADGVPPHRYARTDLFPNDPDYSLETLDTVSEPAELAALLLQQYVIPATHVTFNPALIEPANEPGLVNSYKFRGEESVRSIFKELAMRSKNASWGVNADGEAFFLNAQTTLLTTWREGRDPVSLEESRDLEMVYNRILLTGDYVYEDDVNSEVTARGHYRWRGSYIQPASRATYGERRIRLWIPWIRTRGDSREFAREFFRVYAQPASRYTLEVGPVTALPLPWAGVVRLEDRAGNELITAAVETVRVLFDHAPVLRLTLGPDDPHTHWPEPPHDERWEIPIPQSGHGGDSITFTDDDTSESGLSSTLGSSSGSGTFSGVSSSLSAASSGASSSSGSSSESGVSSTASSPDTSATSEFSQTSGTDSALSGTSGEDSSPVSTGTQSSGITVTTGSGGTSTSTYSSAYLPTTITE